MSAADRASSSSTVEKGSRDPKETRSELGETVAAVTEKTDVKKQAQAKQEDLKAQAGAKADEAKGKLKEVGEKAQEAAPDSARDGVQQAQCLAQENQVPLAIASRGSVREAAFAMTETRSKAGSTDHTRRD